MPGARRPQHEVAPPRIPWRAAQRVFQDVNFATVPTTPSSPEASAAPAASQTLQNSARRAGEGKLSEFATGAIPCAVITDTLSHMRQSFGRFWFCDLAEAATFEIDFVPAEMMAELVQVSRSHLHVKLHKVLAALLPEIADEQENRSTLRR
jgi:hypothetical protein